MEIVISSVVLRHRGDPAGVLCTEECDDDQNDNAGSAGNDCCFTMLDSELHRRDGGNDRRAEERRQTPVGRTELTADRAEEQKCKQEGVRDHENSRVATFDLVIEAEEQKGDDGQKDTGSDAKNVDDRVSGNKAVRGLYRNTEKGEPVDEEFVGVCAPIIDGGEG